MAEKKKNQKIVSASSGKQVSAKSAKNATVKKAAPVAKKVGKGAILVGAGAAAVIAGAKFKGGKTAESDDYDEGEAEEYDTKYAINDDDNE